MFRLEWHVQVKVLVCSVIFHVRALLCSVLAAAMLFRLECCYVQVKVLLSLG